MRPTDLKFRSPKERTPDPYDALVTSNGTALFQYKPRKKSNFSTARRFLDVSSDKVSFWRGPGSYDLSYESIGKRKTKGTHVYRPLHGEINSASNAYYFIGNSIVYDPCFSQKKDKNSAICNVDSNILYKSRPTTASSRKYSYAVKRFMTPQPPEDPRPFSAFGMKSS